jgi:gamma-glutamyltranspeptidase / glutathione hydrolase
MSNLTRRAAIISIGASAIATGASAARASRLTNGAVAGPDQPGAQAGADILAMGGNAVDAAVAIGFALAVTYPEAGNLGGGGFMTVLMRGRPYFLDYRETAPAAASQSMYLGPDGNVIENRSLIGNQAVGIPGTVHGMAVAHARFGKLSWGQVLAPSIKLARDGFVPIPQMISVYQEAAASLGAQTNLTQYFAKLQAGQTFKQPDLASTLERIAAQGSNGFYAGTTANQIVAQMGRGTHKGLITLADLAGYRSVWRQPLRAHWNAMDVFTAPPPSSGGVALIQLLGMKAARPDLFVDVAHNSAQYVHLLAEMEKRVYADRAQYMGDPDFVRVPVSRLLDPAYIASRARQMDPARPSVLASVKPGLEKPQTTHFSVIDSDGNAVSNTYTLNGWFGSGVVVEGAGFILNNEMDDFSAKPGVANQFGLVGGDANAIAPRKRPLSSMTPTILAKNGVATMALGSPGGPHIITAVMQVLLNAYDHNMPLAEAVSKPRYHHQLLPENTIYAETFTATDPAVKTDLQVRGYRIEEAKAFTDVAAIQVIGRTPVVAPDPRARGHGIIV